MKQILQNNKTGKLEILDLPNPALQKGGVLVRNHFSLISTGTEKTSIIIAQSNILSKAKQRPDLVSQVLTSMKNEGLKVT